MVQALVSTKRNEEDVMQSRPGSRTNIKTALLVIIALLCTGSVVAVKPSFTAPASPKFTRTSSQKVVRQPGPDRKAILVPPDQIPDERVYSLLLRVLLTMPDGLKGRRATSYVRYMGLGEPCCGRGPHRPGAASDVNDFLSSDGPGATSEVNDFLSVVGEFGRSASKFDMEAAPILASTGARRILSDAAKKRLASLQDERMALVAQFRTSLTTRLSHDAADRVEKFVQERLKPRVKYARTPGVQAFASVAGFTDSWTYDSEQNEWEGFYNTELFALGVVDADYGEDVAVQSSLINPNGEVVASGGWNAASSWVRSDTATSLDINSSPAGDWRVQSDHWGPSGWLFPTFLGIGSRTYFTRYAYYRSEIDHLGRWYWIYLPYNCGNRCTASFLRIQANDPNGAPPFLGASGKRWSFFGFGFCQMQNRALPQQWTRCDPAY
jgi:hypothetical protein